MSQPPDPAINALEKTLADKLVWAQVIISRRDAGFALRHIADANESEADLNPVSPNQLRDLAMHTESGAFRPLKSAPTLRSGWRCTIGGAAELALALNQLYPGSVPDWFAARSDPPPITHYREFTTRQTGMYRITTLLSDPQAAEVARAVCHPRFCLKQRLWTVGELQPDAPGTKSAIPCLEPCSVLLEMARKATRIEQEPKTPLELPPSDLETVTAALEWSLEHPDPSMRVADFASPSNPRRLQLLLEKLRGKLEVGPNAIKKD